MNGFRFFICFTLLFLFGFTFGHLFGGRQAMAVEVSSGTLEKFEPFESKYFEDKPVYVWLPDGYSKQANSEKTGKRYAVLYMHDAQMLFDANSTWNGQAWDVDDIASELMATGNVRDFIVVASFNGNYKDRGRRRDQYFPQKVFESMSEEQQATLLAQKNGTTPVFAGAIESDNYLKFLVEELKPFVDFRYTTQPDKDNTFVMGSSMGGLISLYAISEYPEVFGGAGCLSTHWIGGNPGIGDFVPEAFVSYMQKHLPDPQSHKIYFDLGTETLDKFYPRYQSMADEVMRNKGYDYRNWITNTYVGDAHEESYWRKRLHIPLLFLLGK